jgi:hypothetical protein
MIALAVLYFVSGLIAGIVAGVLFASFVTSVFLNAMTKKHEKLIAEKSAAMAEVIKTGEEYIRVLEVHCDLLLLAQKLHNTCEEHVDQNKETQMHATFETYNDSGRGFKTTTLIVSDRISMVATSGVVSITACPEEGDPVTVIADRSEAVAIANALLAWAKYG